MNQQQIKINENTLKRIVIEGVKRVLKEYDDGNYFGGGLPDSYFNDEEPEDYSLTPDIFQQLREMSTKLYDIANATSDDCQALYDAAKLIDTFVDSRNPQNVS